MNAFLTAAICAVAAGWTAWLVTGWYVTWHRRRHNAERFEAWMRQERQVTSTLDEIRNLPETTEVTDG